MREASTGASSPRSSSTPGSSTSMMGFPVPSIGSPGAARTCATTPSSGEMSSLLWVWFCAERDQPRPCAGRHGRRRRPPRRPPCPSGVRRRRRTGPRRAAGALGHSSPVPVPARARPRPGERRPGAASGRAWREPAPCRRDHPRRLAPPRGARGPAFRVARCAPGEARGADEFHGLLDVPGRGQRDLDGERRCVRIGCGTATPFPGGGQGSREKPEDNSTARREGSGRIQCPHRRTCGFSVHALPRRGAGQRRLVRGHGPGLTDAIALRGEESRGPACPAPWPETPTR